MTLWSTAITERRLAMTLLCIAEGSRCITVSRFSIAIEKA